MTRERMLGWCGLLAIGLIGAAYRLHDWWFGAPVVDRRQELAPYVARDRNDRSLTQM